MNPNAKLLIFDTHPIQYRAPVFRELSKKLGASFKVCFFNDQFEGAKWWFHEVGTAAAQAWGVNLTEGYSAELLKTEGLSPWKTYKKLKEVLLREKPAAILVYGYYLKEHWILRLLSQQLSIPLLFIGETFTSHSSPARRFLTTPLQKTFLNGVYKFISIGKKTEAFYQSKKIASSDIVSANYCVDIDFFRTERPDAHTKREELRRHLGMKPNDFVLLFVGRLFERKRPRDVIKLHEWLLPLEKVHTLLIGSGPLEGALKSECEDLPRLHWMGFQNQHQIRDSYLMADLLVVPSAFETWGLVINEAFCSGLPALVSDTCGAADDLVEHGETGFIYPVGDLTVALNHIHRLMENRDLLERLGQNAKKRVLAHYRPDQFADSIAQAFHSVVQSEGQKEPQDLMLP